MQQQRSFNTGPEVELRRALHRHGLRYRLHRPIVPGTRRKVDIVFASAQVAVDVRGCYWHGHEHEFAEYERTRNLPYWGAENTRQSRSGCRYRIPPERCRMGCRRGLGMRGPRNRRRPGRPQRTVALGDGLRVPYPEPKDDAATRVGRGNRRSGTKPEQALRAALHRRGLRFRKDLPIRCGNVRVKPDIVFTRARIAVFVDGCFWHCCPDHGVTPKRNASYWVPKLQRNVERDRRADAALQSEGWVVIRVWEHEEISAAAEAVAAAVLAHS